MAALRRDFALEVHFAKWEFSAQYNLAASDAQSVSLSQLLELADAADRDRFERLSLGYTETRGAPSLRRQIATTYETVAPEDILCFAGAGEAVYVAMRVLLDSGDHCIVTTPNYQSAETVPLSICSVTGVPLDKDDHWSLNVDAIRNAIRPNTKLVSVNFPNNPTGSVASQEAFRELVDLCRSRGLWLFSDEVFRLLETDPSRRLPQAVDLYERAISVNVMSKAYGLPGLRIGWLAARDRELLERCERYKHYLSICNSAPSEVLATIALKARDTILERNRNLIRENLKRLDLFFGDFPQLFDWSRPDGGCVSFVRYRGTDGVETFARRLVEEAGVLLLPSSIYRSDLGPVPRDRFRVGFGRAGLSEGLTAFRDWLERNPS